MDRRNSFSNESGEHAVQSHKDSVPLSSGMNSLRQQDDNSQDFFQCAWDRHVSHLREATRASVLASLVAPTTDLPLSAVDRRASSRASILQSPKRHSVVDGTSFDSNLSDSYPHSSSPRVDNPIVKTASFLNDSFKARNVPFQHF